MSSTALPISPARRLLHLGPVGIRMLLQKAIELVNAFLDATDDGVCLRSIASDAHLTGFKQFNLLLKRGSHFDPILDQIMNRGHELSPSLPRDIA
jgi:hypothetical protein